MTSASRRHHYLLGIRILLVSGCASGNGGHAPQPSGQTRPSGLLVGQMVTAPPPPGWRLVLNGERFTGNAAEAGLTPVPARPGWLAGCALPTGPLNAVRTI